MLWYTVSETVLSGPAGENLVKYAGIVSHERAADRTVRVDVKEVKGLEPETLGLLGGNSCNNDLQKILDWNRLLDGLGMDTISTENACVKDVLRDLQAQGIRTKDLDACILLVNGKPAKKRSVLQPGDVVQLMSPVAGG